MSNDDADEQPRYSAGWNQPGCLPDTAEPAATFRDFSDAVQYLVATVTSFWDDDYTNADMADEVQYTIEGAVDEHASNTDSEDADGKWLPVHTALHNSAHTYDDGTHTFQESTGDGGLVFWITPIEA